MRLGIDLGGTKIALVVLDDAGCVRWESRCPTPQGDYEGTVNRITEQVFEAEARVRQRMSVGIGIPGSESPANGLIRNANSTCLNGRPLRLDLERQLQRPIRLANDANCFALSEAVDGSGAGALVVFGLILGTGVGGGLVVNQQVLAGHQGIAGEWGHNPLPGLDAVAPTAPRCYCGRRGCVETYLSGPALSQQHRERTGEDLAAVDIVQRAESGDTASEITLAHWEHWAGWAIASLINVVDPDVIVLGGGLSNCQRFYRTLPDACRPHVFSDVFDTPIRPPKHGDASGVRGAAWLWPVSP